MQYTVPIRRLCDNLDVTGTLARDMCSTKVNHVQKNMSIHNNIHTHIQRRKFYKIITNLTLTITHYTLQTKDATL